MVIYLLDHLKKTQTSGNRRAPRLPYALPDWLIDSAKSIRAHPAFHSSLNVYAREIVDNFQKTSTLVQIVSEEARYLICIAILAMHHARDQHDPSSGPTLSRIQAFATHFDLTSRNRVFGLVNLMRHGGYLTPVRSHADRRIFRLDVTEEGLNLSNNFIKIKLSAIQNFSTEYNYLDLFYNEYNFIDRFLNNGLNEYADGARIILSMPEIDIFMKQNAGREIMFKIWLALSRYGGIPEPRVVNCAYGYMASCFGVSRGHVRRMMERGCDAGFFELRAPGGQAVEIKQSFINVVEALTALEFALMKKAADDASSASGPSVGRWMPTEISLQE